MTDTTPNVNDAAQLVVDVEKQALEKLIALLQDLFDGLDAVAATLPSSINLDAYRIVNELKSQNGYRLQTELPAVLARYNPTAVTQTVAPVAPPYNPEASANVG